MKAVRPSEKSSDRMATAIPSIDIFQPISSGALVASITILRDSRTATGALAQICSASEIASSSACPGSTRRLTRPKWCARVASIGLFVLMILINLYMHAFWRLEGAEAKTQMVQFTKNLAIMGGLLMVVARGPGRASIDAKIRRPLEP